VAALANKIAGLKGTFHRLKISKKPVILPEPNRISVNSYSAMNLKLAYTGKIGAKSIYLNRSI